MSTTAQPLPLHAAPAQRFRQNGLGVVILLLGAIGLSLLMPGSGDFPESWNFGLRRPIDDFQSWVIGHRATHPIFVYFFEPLSDFIDVQLRALEAFLLGLPWPALAVALFAIAYKAFAQDGKRVSPHGLLGALLAVAGLLLIGSFGLWKASMATLALMGVAVFIALLIGIPLGILAARHNRFEHILRPALDAMQTIPAFVYLIPVVLFFGLARVPGVIATVIYALPPAIRLTNLGIRGVAINTTEAADAFGSTAWQKLLKVQLPLALPSILLGINQTMMMALGIVVIAALIGAGGLGLEVLSALRSLRVGQALEAGLAIVLIAVIFDRITYGFSRASQAATQPDSQRTTEQSRPQWGNAIYWITVGLVILLIVLLSRTLIDLSTFPAALRFSIREPVDRLVAWLRDHLYQIGDLPIGTGPFSDFLTIYLLNPLRALFQDVLPWPTVILAVTLLAYQGGGWRLALFSALGSFGLGWLGLWEASMDTLSQVLVAVLLSVLIGVPLGIGAARSDRFQMLLRPLLDFLQTIPPFVYLVPVIMLFNIGRVPGIIASVLYAIPPLIRLTDLGIRQVAINATEAADAFGSTAGQKLVKVELPLALPSIMLGVNQTVMLVLSMVIIAGLVGGGALGIEAVNGLAKNELGRGIEAGLAILLLAMVLDRMTQAWAGKGSGG
ncbi:MAG: ABC transporter permease subunit [Chloroflexota bacterium]|nr:ABC transporter permease subunit [Chloroflexota bacterium]